MSLIKNLAQKAAEAAQVLSVLNEADKNPVLLDMAKA
ncbi:MAG: glutamate-5-semialdehyde dehydrogenase, partial [Pseudomonadales bacterium]